MTKFLAFFLVSVFSFSVPASGEVFHLSCDLVRIKGDDGKQDIRRDLAVMLVADDGAGACLGWEKQPINMDICYAGDIGNFVMRAYKDDGRTLVSSVVSKYGRHDLIPEKFELNAQVGEGADREMIIASCAKNKIGFQEQTGRTWSPRIVE